MQPIVVIILSPYPPQTFSNNRYPVLNKQNAFRKGVGSMKSASHKYILIIVLMLLSLIAEDAFAYIPCMCNNPPDQCTCFIQLGDKGLPVEKIIHILNKKGYLQIITKKAEFTPDVRQAVIQFQVDNNLEPTGWMDDETLDMLLVNELPDVSAIYSMEYWDAICYIPTDGGKKHHADPTCSDMYNPRMISRVNAICLGIEACGKDTCRKTSPLTYSSLGLTPRILPEKYYISMDNTDFQLVTNISDDTAVERSYKGDKESIYIGNKNSHIFHLNTCNSVKSMSENNKIEFQTRNEAINNDYKPCSRCNP